jgi:hypothetical protein
MDERIGETIDESPGGDLPFGHRPVQPARPRTVVA